MLEPLINGKEGKFAELQETIEARKDPARGADAALQIVRSDRGKKAMDDIRKVIAEMKSEEETLLKKRSVEAEQSAPTPRCTIVYGTLAAFVILGPGRFCHHPQYRQSAQGNLRERRSGSPWAT